MITQTGGFGLSASRGRTLTIAKLGRAGGLTAWSGPAYGTCHSAGLGLTFGVKAGGGRAVAGCDPDGALALRRPDLPAPPPPPPPLSASSITLPPTHQPFPSIPQAMT